MALGRREALALGVAGLAAATVGFLAGPWLRGSRAVDSRMLESASFSDHAGKSRRIAEWRGKIVVVNFWATWCAPCREEIPLLMEVRDRYAPSGVEIVGIAVDTAANVVEYANSLKISYPILIAGADGLELIRKLGNTVGGLPYTVFLDRDGGIARTKLGALQRPELEAVLGEILRS